MPVTMEALLTTQNQIMAAINTQCVNFKKDGPDRKTPAYIEKRLNTLDSYWNEFQTNHTRLSAEFEDLNHRYFIENHYQRTKEFYHEVRNMISTYLTSEPSKPLLRPATPLAQGSDRRDISSPAQEGTSFSFHAPTLSNQGSSSRVEDMLRKQKSNFKALSRTIEAVDLETCSERWEFEDILRSIQSRWSVIDSLHWDIDSEGLLDNEEYETAFVEMEKKYNTMKKLVNRQMWSSSYRERSTPQMDIPTFSGNYQDWMCFKDLFTETIHNNKSLPNAQKMQFLKSKLRGEAEKLVHHLRINSENYDVCWNILQQRYQNTRLIFNSHIQLLLNMPTIQQQSAAVIKRLHDTTNECLNSIKAMGIDISKWDPLIVYILCQKLDTESHHDYIESLRNPKELPTLSEFLNFLEIKFTSLESSRRKQDYNKPGSSHVHQNHNQNPWVEKQPNNHLHNFMNRNFKSRPAVINHVNTKPMHIATQQKCILCKNCCHELFKCKQFLESTPLNRLKVIETNKLCKNCLINHYDKECYSEKTCRFCNNHHNTLLHNALVTFTPSDSGNSNIENPDRKSNIYVTNTPQETMPKLLATANVNIRSIDGCHHTMRALIDPCAESSLITENAAQLLGLPRIKRHCVVVGVGAKSNNSEGVIQMQVSSIYDNFTFKTEAYIMKYVVGNLPNKSIEKPNWSYLQRLSLADPEFYRSKPIDLILSVDVYELIILPGLINNATSLPMAQNTKLGWIISGTIKPPLDGFNLRKCSSNNSDLLPYDLSSCEDQAYVFKHQESTKALGLKWLPNQDYFTFQLKSEPVRKLTKRILLSNISKIFDPLGWLSPVTTKLKLLFQEVWLLNLQWDDDLPTDISARWKTMKNDITNINHITIPRWLQSSKNDTIELHGFCDSSQNAYACVIYCRVKNITSNQYSVVLVAAKSRLVPVKKSVSLPRLELCAALLLTKVMRITCKCLCDYDIKIYGWSDSTAVLGWLNGEPSKWKPFVANKVKQVIEVIPPGRWHYVSTKDNPADCASRGITTQQLINHSMWWTGPHWLQSFEESKLTNSSYTTNEELKKQILNINVTTINKNEVIENIISTYSDFTRASRVLTWVLRFTSKSLNKSNYLNILEIRKAKYLIIKYVQQIEFLEDIQYIKNHNQPNPKSNLLKLKPFIDDQGLLRVGGRLTNAKIEDRMKHPCILPHNHQLTDMIIDQAHKMTFHGGARLTLAWLRQEYWIVGENSAVKKRLRRCVVCRRPGKWAPGRIVQLHPGPDDLATVVSIKNKNEITKRPIVKLSLLPINHTNDGDMGQISQNFDINQPENQSKNSLPKPKRRARKGIYHLFTKLFMLFNLLFSPAMCAYNTLKLNDSQGLYFDKVSTMRLIQDEWKLVVYYDLEPYYQGSKLLNKYIDHMDYLCKESPIRNHCEPVLIQLRHSYTEFMQYNNILSTQQFSRGHARRKRGLINAVGNVAHALFGVLDDQFAEQYVKDIDLIKENQNHLAALWKNQTSVVEAEYNVLKRMQGSIDKQHKIFTHYLNQLENTTNIVKGQLRDVETTNTFLLCSMAAQSLESNLKKMQDILLDTVSEVYFGKFNIHLLKPEQLLEELNIISGKLSNDLSLPIEHTHTELTKIYHLLQVRARMMKDYFIFEIKIPLVSRDNYQLYRIYSLPRMYHKTMVTLVPASDYVGINLQRDSFITISQLEFHKCIHLDSETQLCPLQKPISHMSHNDILCSKDQETKQCLTNTANCQDRWSQLNDVNTYLFFCCNSCPVRIICGEQMFSDNLNTSGIIRFGQDCVLKGNDITIHTQRLQNNTFTMKTDIPTIDILPINHIFNHNKTSASLSPKLASVMDGYDQDLNDIGVKIKQMQSESGLKGGISYHDVHHYVAIYVVAGVLVAFAAAYAGRRCTSRRQDSRAPVTAGTEPVASDPPRPEPRGLANSAFVYSVSDQCVSVVNHGQSSVKNSA